MSIVKFYRNDPNAPKTTMKTHLGVNAIITSGDKLLLERRSDSGTWGLVGGGMKNYEEPIQAITREIWEELGVRIPKDQFKKICVYGEPGRIAAYRDGSIWQMVIVLFQVELPETTQLRVSSESLDLKWFTREELKETEIIVVHSDIVEEQFINRMNIQKSE